MLFQRCPQEVVNTACLVNEMQNTPARRLIWGMTSLAMRILSSPSLVSPCTGVFYTRGSQSVYVQSAMMWPHMQ